MNLHTFLQLDDSDQITYMQTRLTKGKTLQAWQWVYAQKLGNKYGIESFKETQSPVPNRVKFKEYVSPLRDTIAKLRQQFPEAARRYDEMEVQV